MDCEDSSEFPHSPFVVPCRAHCCSDMTCNVKTHEAIPVCRSDDMKVTEISLLRVKREGQLAHMLPNRGHQPLDADSIFPLIQFRVATTNEELTHGHTESRALKFKVKVEQKKLSWSRIVR